MKTISTLIKTLKKSALALSFCLLGYTAFGQQRITVNLPVADNKFSNVNKASSGGASMMAKDTVECLFHQILDNNRPLLTWRKGYIVLEDMQIRIADQLYPTSRASNLTGLIQNQFLASNKKKPVTKKVVQVVLLQ